MICILTEEKMYTLVNFFVKLIAIQMIGGIFVLVVNMSGKIIFSVNLV